MIKLYLSCGNFLTLNNTLMKYLMIAALALTLSVGCKKDTQTQDQQQQQFKDVEISKPTGVLYQANSQTVGMRYTFYITIKDSAQLKEIICNQQSPTLVMWRFAGPWKSGSYSFNRVTGNLYAMYYFEVVLKNGIRQRFPTWQIE